MSSMAYFVESTKFELCPYNKITWKSTAWKSLMKKWWRSVSRFGTIRKVEGSTKRRGKRTRKEKKPRDQDLALHLVQIWTNLNELLNDSSVQKCVLS